MTATAHDRLVSRLRRQILSGELKAGDRLPPESTLSQHYDVSRNTAREAMRSLASQGLVISKRGTSGGTFVAHPTPTQISASLQSNLTLLTSTEQLQVSSLVEIREWLEIPATEMAARRRTDDDVTALRDALYDPSDVDVATVFQKNRAFHFLVLRAAHNSALQLVAEPVFQVIEDRMERERAGKEFWVEVDHDHRDIINFIESGDQAGAREAARAHLRSLRRGYEDIARSAH